MISVLYGTWGRGRGEKRDKGDKVDKVDFYPNAHPLLGGVFY
ncbi:MAG: hypothetical protein ACRAVC_17565 [Trichormus sp.]